MNRLFILIISLLVSACGNFFIKNNESEQFLMEDPCSFSAYDSVALMDKGIIQKLIPLIADSTKVFVGSQDPRSSYLGDLYILTGYNNRKSICYARLIDFYLSYSPDKEKEYLAKKALPEYEGWMTGRFYIHHPYKYGIIVKLDKDGSIIPKPLEISDIYAIHDQYSIWWIKHRFESLPNLRKHFMEDGGILKEPYRWI